MRGGLCKARGGGRRSGRPAPPAPDQVETKISGREHQRERAQKQGGRGRTSTTAGLPGHWSWAGGAEQPVQDLTVVPGTASRMQKSFESRNRLDTTHAGSGMAAAEGQADRCEARGHDPQPVLIRGEPALIRGGRGAAPKGLEACLCTTNIRCIFDTRIRPQRPGTHAGRSVQGPSERPALGAAVASSSSPGGNPSNQIMEEALSATGVSCSKGRCQPATSLHLLLRRLPPWCVGRS